MKPISNAMKLAIAVGAVVSMVSGPLAYAEPRTDKNPVYTAGVVSNPDLHGPAGQLVLNVYLGVGKDGTGVGVVSDALHPEVNAHLAVQQTTRQGHTVHFAGVVIAANDGALVGQRFVVKGVVTGTFTTLELQLEDARYFGQGTFTRTIFDVVNLAKELCEERGNVPGTATFNACVLKTANIIASVL